MEAIELHYSRLRFDDEEFYEFCQQNDGMKFERDANGTIFVMPNTGGKTGDRNSEINFQLRGWNKQQRSGRVFDSSTAFRLPSSAVRSADAAFVTNDRWADLTDSQQNKFPPLCPDFIIELRSPSDTVKELRQKIQDDWMANGCALAWLIDPDPETAYVYRADGSVQIIHSFDKPLSGETMLPGFLLILSELRS